MNIMRRQNDKTNPRAIPIPVRKERHNLISFEEDLTRWHNGEFPGVTLKEVDVKRIVTFSKEGLLVQQDNKIEAVIDLESMRPRVEAYADEITSTLKMIKHALKGDRSIIKREFKFFTKGVRFAIVGMYMLNIPIPSNFIVFVSDEPSPYMLMTHSWDLRLETAYYESHINQRAFYRQQEFITKDNTRETYTLLDAQVNMMLDRFKVYDTSVWISKRRNASINRVTGINVSDYSILSEIPDTFMTRNENSGSSGSFNSARERTKTYTSGRKSQKMLNTPLVQASLDNDNLTASEIDDAIDIIQ